MVAVAWSENSTTVVSLMPFQAVLQKDVRTSTLQPFPGNWVYDRTCVSTTGYSTPPTSSLLRDGWKDPEWNQRIAENQLASYPYNRSGVSHKPGLISVSSDSGPTVSGLTRYRVASTNGHFISGMFNPLPAVLSTTSLKNNLMTSMAAYAKSSSLQAVVSLMEGPKTFRLLADTAFRVAHVLQVARRSLRGDTRALRQLLERMEVHGVQDALKWYLEYRYGWRILLMEMEAARQAIEAEMHIATEPVRARDRFTTGGTLVSSVAGSMSSGQLSMAPNVIANLVMNTTKETYSELVAGEALGFYLLDDAAALQKQLGLHALPTVWELIPGSFIADWFVNIGDWLQAFASITPGFQWLGGQYSQLQRTKIVLKVVGGYYGSTTYPLVVHSNGETEITRYSFARSLENPAVPLPPVIANDLNLLRCIDAVALLVNRYGRLSRDAATWRFSLPKWS